MIPFVVVKTGTVVNVAAITQIDNLSTKDEARLKIYLTDGRMIQLDGKEADAIQVHLGVCQSQWKNYIAQATSPLVQGLNH